VNGSGWLSDRRHEVLAGALLVLAAIVVRLPILVNASGGFNSDEAVNALVMKRFAEHGEVRLHNWDTGYFGIVEGLFGLALVPFLGWTPLAFKLGATACFLAAMVFAQLLARRLAGPAAGLLAAALLVSFSPPVVRWSTTAAGAYLLVVAWGSASLLMFDHLSARGSPRRLQLLAFGAMLGFGMYIYELYLVYLCLFVGWGVGFVATWLLALARDATQRTAAIWHCLDQASALLLGFALGWSPKLVPLATGSPLGSLQPSYGLASPPRALENLVALVLEVGPALFGINTATGPGPLRDTFVGRSGPWSVTLGAIVVLVCILAGLFAARRESASFAADLRAGTWRPGTRLLLLGLLPLTTAMFVLSRNSGDMMTHRYLLPLLTPMPVLTGIALAALGRKRAWAAIAVLALLLSFPLVQLAFSYRAAGYLGPGWRLRESPETLHDVLAFLERRGIRGGYASYWTSYKATFLAGERLVFAPLDDWQRYPPYRRLADRLGQEAYLVRINERGQAENWGFLLAERLREGGVKPAVTLVGDYFVFTSPHGGRLLRPRPDLHEHGGRRARSKTAPPRE
jgi:hypothetical protein